MPRFAWLCTGLALWLAACSPVIPSKTIQLTDTIAFTAADALLVTAVVGAMYVVVDPLAPNWEVRHTKLDDTRYRIEMRKKRITTGGDGEAIDLFHRHADDISAQARSPSYTILSWNEGVESEFPIARRWARGEIQLQAPGAIP
jgi:hypothetical protein